MAMIECKDFWELFRPWMEGERHPDAEAHLDGCGHCRALLTDLEAIRAAGHEMAESASEPPERVWIGLRARLEEEGLIRQHGWAERLARTPFLFPRPALAGAYLSLGAIAGLLVVAQVRGLNETLWFNGTRVLTASLDHQLQAVEQDTVSAMHERDPDVTASLSQNLAIVDNYIALCEKSVRDDPGDEMARDYLYGAYQQKADLLATMMERGVTAQ